MKKVSIISLGCPKNLVDSERVLAKLSKDYKITFDPDKADIVVINTCAFLNESRQEGEYVIQEFLDKKKNGKIEKVVVLGCYPSLDIGYLKKKFKDVDAFVGTNNLKSIQDAIKKGGAFIDPLPELAEFPRLQLTLPHYAYLKIADGCNHRCAFCLIPKIKGNLHSFPMEFLVDEAKALVKNGARELILIAQDTTQYGMDVYGGIKTIELLEQLEKIEDLKWIRILYTYPVPYIKDLIKYMRSSKKNVPYIDMPIQHASERILRLMKRGYSKKELEDIAEIIKSNELTFRTSVIVGFPTETDNDFKELKQFIKQYEIDHIGIFKYSNERGVNSYKLSQVDGSLIDERFEELSSLKDELARKRTKQFLGKEIEFVIDYYDEENKLYVGRSSMDAPEIDNIVYTKDSIQTGQFYKGVVKNGVDYEWEVEVKK